MPSSSAGRIVKTSKGKKGTAHQKNHRWESFTAKVAKLNSLDPLRRVRRYDLDTESFESTTSYFRNGLEKWQDLNLSENFIAFSREIEPLAESLPQILHFESKIMGLLMTYLEKKDRESVEPLLYLLTDFAHDLGTRFEKHYARALTVVTSIAGIPQDVEVVEWTFTCLAFMFKYLSKLLVTDLRPTYDLVAPLLGKDKQQPHIARFAAEAMSFLVKKAGAPAVREKALPLILSHVKDDLRSMSESPTFILYYHGVMTMLAESMKGTGLTVHTSGSAVLRAMVSELKESDIDGEGNSIWLDVICGVLTSLVHHTSSSTLIDIVEEVLAYSVEATESFEANATPYNTQRIVASARMIGVVTGVRKGSRIDKWTTLLDCMSKMLVALSKPTASDTKDTPMFYSVGITAATFMQYAPMDALIPFIAPFLNSLTKDPFAAWFLTFCSYLASVDIMRFRSLVLPYFQRFVVAHWSEADNEDTLLVLVPKLVDTQAILSSIGGKDGFNVPQSWQDQIVSKFERLETSPFPEQSSPAFIGKSPQAWHERCLPKYNALLKVMERSSVHPSTNARIAEILLRKLKLALRPSSTLAPEESHFIVGRGFNAYSRMSRGAGMVDSSLESLLRAAAPRYARLPNFLEAMLAYLTSLETSKSKLNPQPEDQVDLLMDSLILNLATDSHELRLLSLRLLEKLLQSNGEATPDCLATMLMIENTPLDLQTARSSSMHIRKLAATYSGFAKDPVLGKAVPYFCFGMLTVKFSQIWDDASAALAQIAQTKVGEDAVTDITYKWLDHPSAPWDGSSKPTEQHRSSGLTDFECTNLMFLKQTAVDVETETKEARSTMLESFATEQKQINACPANARSQALRVLAAIPQVAEKKSRQLVPMFLSWAARESVDTEDVDGTGAVSNWTRRDQKSLLDVFALFHNPRVLFRAVEVQTALLGLIGNGDLETQKAALKAINTWKLPGVRPYEENLKNLLDEARFKDEITILLGGETRIQPEHRQELMPVLLRILYGRTISRKGAASGKQGMAATRLIVLRNLTIEDTGAFLDIALGDLNNLELIQDATIFDREILSIRKQLGFVHMMEAVLKELASHVLPFTQKLLSAILYCLIYSARQLNKTQEDDEDESGASQTSMLKVIRQTGFRCLILLFTNDAKFDWSPYIPLILKDLVSPRLEKMPIETAQGVSGLLQLLSTWSASPKTVMILAQDDRILPKITECLEPPKSQNSVKLYALGIVKHMVNLAKDISDANETVVQEIKALLSKHMDTMLGHIGGILRSQQDMNKELLEACVETVSQLAPFVVSSAQAQNLVDISTFLLDQPTRRVNPRTKGGLLLILEHFVPLYNLQEDEALKSKIYNTITSLFGFFKDQSSREVLSRVLLVFSRTDPVLAEVAEICLSLNSFKEGRLDEPDYDRRLQAFTTIAKHEPFTPYQWRPLLYNALFYIRHDEEFGILSSNSSDAICRFLDTAASADSSSQSPFEVMLSTILLPALFAGAREPSEIIRREYVKVMAHLVRVFPEWSEVSDMHSLLNGEDEVETSFFNNILTAGKGRQSSALSILSSSSDRGDLSSRNVSHFFIPLIEHFIFDRAEGNEAHSLAAEASKALGVLAGSLEWQQYRALLRRLIDKVTAKPELEKQIIRLLGMVIDRLALVAGDADEDDMVAIECRLAKTLPKKEKFAEDLTSNVLPPLLTYLHDKDESTVSLRVPVAVIIVRLLKLLPQEQLTERLPGVLTDICHILRSKAQEARDMTRDTLVKICVLLGPSCFGFVLKELRGALARGYQLHVLSYTMHAMLVATTPEYSPGDLDYCLPTIVAIIMDDIFGATGQEKDAEEYVSKMKEVKSSKSHDSMELIAKTATLSRLTVLVRPIQVLLKEKLDIRMVRKIDELLNRVTSGLLKNSAADSRDSLVFCYEVIMDVYASNKPQAKVKEDYRLKKYLVQKGAKKSGSSRSSTTVYTYKLVRFSFDVLRTVLKKHDALRTQANLAGFIPIIGDALVQAEEEIKIAAFKLLTTIAKVPLKSEGTSLFKVGASETIKCITASSTTTSDIAQAGLKLLSVILRDRKDVPVKDTAIDTLLTRLKDDMTDPERRHVTFSFLRSVLDSKVETALVYDILDYAGTVMVTNDDKDTRDLARGAYFQFLKEYPQMKKRWSKQISFIVANLKYEREGGRLSILEVIHLLLSKSSDDFVQEVSATCFVPLIFVLVNDESEKCRMAAGEVLKSIFQKADEERTKTFLGMLRSWLKQVDNPSVLRLAFQSYGFYYEVNSDDDSDVGEVQTSLLAALQTDGDAESDWEMIYAALQLATVLCQTFQSRMLSSETSRLWTSILSCISYPHAWVKLSAAKLAGVYFADFARTNAEAGLALPMKGSQGLKLKADAVQDLIRRTTGLFKTPGLTEQLATEAVKDLAFLGRCADASDLEWKSTKVDSDDEDAEDSAKEKSTALNYLLSRLSYILRRETSPPRAPVLIPKTSAMQLLTLLCSKLSVPTLTSLLPTILLPLHNITDPSIPSPYSTDELFRTNYDTLKSDAIELMSDLQKRIGTEVYTKQLLKVRQGVKARRDARTTKRRIEAVSMPEKYGVDKKKKVERKKERRKERGMEHRDRRNGF